VCVCVCVCVYYVCWYCVMCVCRMYVRACVCACATRQQTESESPFSHVDNSPSEALNFNPFMQANIFVYFQKTKFILWILRLDPEFCPPEFCSLNFALAHDPEFCSFEIRL